MRPRKTPLRKWLEANDMTAAGLGQTLNVSRQRVGFWVMGAAMPRGRILLRLMQLTGLDIPQLLPNLTLQQQRRDKERIRKAGAVAKVYQMVREKHERSLAKNHKRGSHV